MSIYDDVQEVITTRTEEVLRTIYPWVHNNPSATAGQASTAINAWEDSQGWTPFSEQIITYLVNRFGSGSWITFRNKILNMEESLVDEFIEDGKTAEDVSGFRSKAETIKDALIATGSAPEIVRDSSGIEWKRNFTLSETVTGTVNGTPYTVRQLSDPTFDGTRTDPNPLGWGDHLMADYFVKTDGNDGNDGSTWALAKATIQAALNIVTTGGNHRVIVAVGEYSGQLSNPNNAGSSGNTNVLIADTQSNIEDGGTNTSGVEPGKVIVSIWNAGNYLDLADLIEPSTDAKWDYWKIQGFDFWSGGRFIDIVATTLVLNLDIDDCNIYCGSTALNFAVDENSQITINRCYMTSPISPTSLRVYATSFPAGASIVLNDCFIEGASGISNALISVTGSSSSTYSYVELNRCTLVQPFGKYLINNSSATYSKTELNDCLCITSATVSFLNDNGTHSGNYVFETQGANGSLPAGFTKYTGDKINLSLNPSLRSITQHYASGPATGTDMVGVSRAGNVGAFEAQAKKHPKYQVVGTSNGELLDWDTSAGGGGGGRRPRAKRLGEG